MATGINNADLIALQQLRMQYHVKIAPPTESGVLEGNVKYIVAAKKTKKGTVKHHRHDGSMKVQSKWLGETKRRKHQVKLPEALVQLFKEEYFCNDDESTKAQIQENQHSPCVFGYTSYLSKDGTRYVASPNWMGKGEQYDWAIISDPNKGWDWVLDYEAHDNKKLRKRRKLNPNNEPSTAKCRWDSYYNEATVPCHILTFFICPITKTNKAIVHPCRLRMKKNEDWDSVLTESWHLQAQPADEPGKMHPMYTIIDVETILRPARVFQETSKMFEETWEMSDDSCGHVIMLHLPDETWSEHFYEFHDKEP